MSDILIVMAIILLVLLKFYLKSTSRWCRSYTCLVGKTVVVYGGATGIGYYAALEFAKRGAKVIITDEHKKNCEDAVLEIHRQTDNPNVSFKALILPTFESLRRTAEEIKITEDRLDILVNSAKDLEIDNEKMLEDHLLVMHANYFCHFLFTHLLMGLMKKTGSARIVNVASIVANYEKMVKPETFNRYPGVLPAYCNSELCNILFTQELGYKLHGTEISTFSVHPGTIKSKIFRHKSYLRKVLNNAIDSLYHKTAEERCQTTLYCALQKGIECYSGEHFVDLMHVDPQEAARNSILARQVWDASEQGVQLREEEKYEIPDKIHLINYRIN